jgi:hypothetical protein
MLFDLVGYIQALTVSHDSALGTSDSALALLGVTIPNRQCRGPPRYRGSFPETERSKPPYMESRQVFPQESMQPQTQRFHMESGGLIPPQDVLACKYRYASFSFISSSPS